MQILLLPKHRVHALPEVPWTVDRGLWTFARVLLVVMTLTALPGLLLAQSRVVTGTITDESGAALPGVSVIEKVTSNGTVSDVAGKYSLSVSAEATIAISFIGMKPLEKAVGSLSAVDFIMEPDVATLNEVMVVDYGYGTVKKSDMTGSVASIGAKELSKIPV